MKMFIKKYIYENQYRINHTEKKFFSRRIKALLQLILPCFQKNLGLGFQVKHSFHFSALHAYSFKKGRKWPHYPTNKI